MYCNGTISFLNNNGSTEFLYNEFGEVVPNTGTWSDPLPCSIKTNNENHLGRYEDGIFKIASYSIMIPTAQKIEAERIRLYRESEFLGDFSVLSIESVKRFNRIIIIV